MKKSTPCTRPTRNRSCAPRRIEPKAAVRRPRGVPVFRVLVAPEALSPIRPARGEVFNALYVSFARQSDVYFTLEVYFAKMDQLTLTTLARQIVENEILLNWRFHGLLLLLVFVAASGASFLTSYFKNRGKSFATKVDFDSLLTQLKKTTEVAEKIRSEISREEWALKEFKTLRRTKLEELMLAVFATHHWLDKERASSLFGGEKNAGPEPATKVSLISGLYFPELAIETVVFHKCFLAYQGWLTASSEKLINSKHDLALHKVALEEAVAGFTTVYQPLLDATFALETKAREVMKNIFGTNF